MTAFVQNGGHAVSHGHHPWIATRLGMMMLLEFVVFGSWFATLGLVLATHGMGPIIGEAYLLSAVAAIVSPLLLGAIGDRYLSPRTVLALAHFAGAVLMLGLPGAIAAGNGPLTVGLIFGYMLAFQPTLGLVNTLGLGLLGERHGIFPYVRVFGPLGWVLAGVVVGGLGLSASTGVFTCCAIASVALGAYALTLPATPPAARGERFSLGDIIGVRAFVLFRNRSFAVLMICALMTSVSLGVYNAFASPYLSALGLANVAGMMAMGQASEVALVVTIPFVLKRIGMKWALLTGMAAWGVRFACFAAAAHGQLGYAYAAVLLHGICNDYFIIVAAMFIARIAPVELAAQAQGWLILMVSGFGQAIGSSVSGAIYASRVLPAQATEGAIAWTPMWSVPIALAVATAVVWIALFRSKPVSEPHAPARVLTP